MLKIIAAALAMLASAIMLSQSPVFASDDDTSHRRLVAKIRPSVTTIRVQGRDGTEIGIGTGFVISADGMIATNFHVINEGRAFTVESADGRLLPILSVEASDVTSDLAIIRVDAAELNLPALEFADSDESEQGMRVLAFGNPLGLQNSVVEGIVSAKRVVEGHELLQLAMPVEPGNSGGPLVDLQGRVHGIVNMKSAINDNLGFAIPIRQLIALQEKPNPVAIDRWVRLGRINEDRWTPLFGATWQQRGGCITVQGVGDGFGGRSLLLSNAKVPELPFEVAVTVRLDDESGAAGLTFHSDGNDQHYGFYPTAGRMRLTRFRGPSVYSWQILAEVETDFYFPGQWNELKVRIETEKIQCFVNGHLVIESSDTQLTDGRVGLAKFRSTKPEFKRFKVGAEIESPALSRSAQEWLDQLDGSPFDIDSVGTEQINELGKSAELSSRGLVQRALALEKQAEQLRGLADDVRRAPTISQLERLDELRKEDRLLRGTLLISALDNPDIDIDAYITQIDEMSAEISARLGEEASPAEKREALHRYLFEENGYHGSRSEYYHPANSHLNRVIDDREGLPITMTILYIELGRRLGLEIEGVGLPGHFVARHVVSQDYHQLVDVFESGKLLTRDDAERMVVLHTGRRLREDDLRTNTIVETLTRVLNNMLGIAASQEDSEAMLRYSDAVLALDPNQLEVRMLRIQLRGISGRTQAAIEDLDWLREHNPPGSNRAALARLRTALESRN